MSLTIAILGLVRHDDPAGRLDRAAERRWRRLRRELREELGDLDQVCKCTCIRNVHRHWNDRTYCGRCGKGACPVFRPARRKIIFRRNR